MNVGSLFRSAHAFGAGFVFAIAPSVDLRKISRADTSGTYRHVPLYEFAAVSDMILPRGCHLVGVELLDDAHDLPSFTHPEQAAYILGPEKGDLSPAIIERCDHLVKIPTKFCVNVGVAGAILMYDRWLSRGRFAPRPVSAGGPTAEMPPRLRGGRLVSYD